MPKVSIIIVSRNGLEDLKICLPSIINQTYQNYEVCIIDNNSTDGTQNYIESLQDNRFRSIILDDNYGFALPNNIGYKNTSGEYILTLNNDIELTQDFLLNAVKFLDTTDELTYSINPKMIYYFERDKINTIGIGILKNGNGYNIGKGEPIENYNKIQKIYGACGGAAFYKRSIIDILGYLFDNSYFAYLEDLDLSIRANLGGYKSLYFPDAICYHKHSNTSKRFPAKKIYLIERNRLRNLIKYYPIKLIITEWYRTINSMVRGYNDKKISNDQKNMIKKIWLILYIVIKTRLIILSQFFHLLSQRKKIIGDI